MFFCIVLFSCKNENINTKPDNITTLCDSAWAYRRTSFEKSLSFAEKAIEEAQNTNRDLLAKAYFHKGSTYLNNGKAEESIIYYKIADSLFTSEDTLYYGKNLNGIGLANADLSQFEEAKVYYNKALIFFIKQNSLENQAVEIQNIGVIDFQQGKIEQALNSYLKVDSIFRQLKNPNKSRIAVNLYNIAIVYKVLNEREKSRSIYFEAIENFKAVNDLVGIAQVYTNLGANYFDENKDSSFKYHTLSFQTYQSINHNLGMATSLSYLADLNRDKGEFEKAIENYKNAIEIQANNKFNFGLNYSLISLGMAYRLKGDYNKAIECLQTVIDSAKASGTIDHQQRAYAELYEVYLSKKEYEKALNTLNISHVLKDSLVNTAKYEAIKSIEAKFESDKKQQQIEQLTLENKIISLRFITGIAFVIFLLIVVFIILNRRLAIRKRDLALFEAKNKLTEQELSLTEKELENERLKFEKTNAELELRKKLLLNYALRISNKNQFLDGLKEKIKDKTVPDTDRLKQISQLINRNLIAESELKELDTIMESVGADFYLKLSKYSSEFNETEKKICVFLSLDMSSKDISSILAISPKTIDNYRSSIRKKLGIDAEENLYSKLNNL